MVDVDGAWHGGTNNPQDSRTLFEDGFELNVEGLTFKVFAGLPTEDNFCQMEVMWKDFFTAKSQGDPFHAMALSTVLMASDYKDFVTLNLTSAIKLPEPLTGKDWKLDNFQGHPTLLV
ncbi:hypothetical protein SUGI_0740560 [Cryptomeria japonica]|nr:hypothetical protein SUGI_0740560 [Cryptomeria japonica]